MNSQAGFIIALFLIMFSVSVPLYYVGFRMLRSIRVKIEKKIDLAMNLQSGDLAQKIKTLQADVNELKSEIRTLRTISALINKTPLPDCMGEKR